MIKVDPGVQVESLALQEVKLHPSMGGPNTAMLQVTYYIEINGNVCGPCVTQVDTSNLPEQDEGVAKFLQYVEKTVVATLGGRARKEDPVTQESVPEGIIKKGF